MNTTTPKIYKTNYRYDQPWRDPWEQAAKENNLIFSTNIDNGVHSLSRSFVGWRLWQGGREYTVALLEDNQFKKHKFFPNFDDAVNYLLKKLHTYEQR